MTARNLITYVSVIERRIDAADRILLGFDFDGTLAPICSRPDEVVLPTGVRKLLKRLSRVPRVTLMIVSGREIQDVTRRVGLLEPIYAGNHGLEIQGSGIAFEHPAAARLARPLSALVGRVIRRVTVFPGAIVESKGLTASVHYRTVPSEFWEEIGLAVREVVSPLSDRFVVLAGHCVWEIRPRVRWHKGRALRRILNRIEPALAFYFGDDLTDEDAFRELAEGVTVKIGNDSSSTLARYRLADPTDVERFLDWLVKKVTHSG